MIPKVIAYLTHSCQPEKILVFRQPDFPSVGIQVPAGTIEENETPEQAVLREVREETGIQELQIVRFLGEELYDMSQYKPEVHYRYFFHVECLQLSIDETWSHVEQYGTGKGVLFEFLWADLTGLDKKLIAGQGNCLKNMQR